MIKFLMLSIIALTIIQTKAVAENQLYSLVGGEQVKAGSEYPIYWVIDKPDTVSVSYYDCYSAEWKYIQQDVLCPYVGIFNKIDWNVPENYYSDKVRIKIESRSKGITYLLSTTYFSISPYFLKGNTYFSERFGIGTENENIVKSNDFVDIKAYPNPVYESKTLNLQYWANINTVTTCKISNSLGQIVYTKEFFSRNGLNLTKLDLSNLNKGVYFVNLLSPNQTFSLNFILE